MSDLAASAPAPDALPAVDPAPAPAPEVKVEGAPADQDLNAKPEGEAKPAESPDATLARRQLIVADKKLSKAKAALAEVETIRARAALTDDAENLLRTDPEAFFARFNLTAEDVLTATVAKASGKPATLTDQERIDALEKTLKDEREAKTTSAEQQKVEAVNSGVKEFIEKAGEEFDLVNTYERHGDVAAAFLKYTEKYPRLTRDQTEKAVRYFARALENELETEQFEKLTKSKKFASKFAPRESQNPESSKSDANSNGDSKTLHNGIVRTSPPIAGDLDGLSDAERWREIKRRAGIRN